MTIKQQGGIFGRNPTFNDVTVDGTLTSSNLAVDTDTLYVDSTNDRVGINISSPTESLDLGASHQNIRVSSRSHVGSVYSSQSTVLGHAVKADTTADQMVVTETNSGGGAPAAIKMTSGTIQFHTAASGTVGAAFNSEGARFTSNGNLAFVSGKGIDFSATAGTGTSELFDDYEEGTWTPTQGTFGTWTSPTFDARYTKIGNVVSFSLRQTGGTIDPDGAKKAIGGLPYAVAVAASCSVSAGSGSWDLGNALIWTDETIGLGLDVGPQTALVIFGQYITG